MAKVLWQRSHTAFGRRPFGAITAWVVLQTCAASLVRASGCWQRRDSTKPLRKLCSFSTSLLCTKRGLLRANGTHSENRSRENAPGQGTNCGSVVNLAKCIIARAFTEVEGSLVCIVAISNKCTQYRNLANHFSDKPVYWPRALKSPQQEGLGPRNGLIIFVREGKRRRFPTAAPFGVTLICACIESEMLDFREFKKAIVARTYRKGDQCQQHLKESHHSVHLHIQTSHFKNGCGKFLK